MLIENRTQTLRTKGYAIVLSGLLLGCASTREPPKTFRPDGKPLVSLAESVEVAVVTQKKFPRDPITTQWVTSLLEVDGIAVPKGYSKVQLVPGKHTFKIECGGHIAPRDTGWISSVATRAYDLPAGSLYYQRVSKVVPTAYEQFSTGSVESRGGFCTLGEMSTRNPFSEY